MIAPQRTKDILYTAPYFDAGLFLFFPADGRIAEDAGDLSDVSIAVELGSLGHVEALCRQKQVERLTVLPFENVAEAMAATAEGKADAALIDYVSGRLFLRDHPTEELQMTFAPIPDASEPYALAVRIDDEMLLSELNAALARLSASGRLEAIIEQHVGR